MTRAARIRSGRMPRMRTMWRMGMSARLQASSRELPDHRARPSAARSIAGGAPERGVGSRVQRRERAVHGDRRGAARDRRGRRARTRRRAFRAGRPCVTDVAPGRRAACAGSSAPSRTIAAQTRAKCSVVTPFQRWLAKPVSARAARLGEQPARAASAAAAGSGPTIEQRRLSDVRRRRPRRALLLRAVDVGARRAARPRRRARARRRRRRRWSSG